MKTIVAVISMTGVLVGFIPFVTVVPQTNSPPVTFYPVTNTVAPTELGAPIVNVAGAIHINGKLALPVPGLARGGLLVDNISQTTYQRWYDPTNLNLYVERAIVINGVDYKDDSTPLAISWTATIGGQGLPVVIPLHGDDFNCSGGGITVTP